MAGEGKKVNIQSGKINGVGTCGLGCIEEKNYFVLFGNFTNFFNRQKCANDIGGMGKNKELCIFPKRALDLFKIDLALGCG